MMSVATSLIECSPLTPDCQNGRREGAFQWRSYGTAWPEVMFAAIAKVPRFLEAQSEHQDADFDEIVQSDEG